MSVHLSLGGPDVSHWQGTVHWPLVAAAGYRWAAMKATDGVSYVDPTFQANWKGAGAAGLARTAYHFGHPHNAFAPEAVNFVHAIKAAGGLGPNDTVCLDIEDVCAAYKAAHLPHTTIVAWIRAWLSTVQSSLGIGADRVKLYTGDWWWVPETGNDKSVAALGYGLWVSDYNHKDAPALFGGWTTWWRWQQTDKAAIPGIGHGDLSVAPAPVTTGTVPAVGTSLNGQPAPPARLATGTIPGTQRTVTLDARFLPLALAFLADFNHIVQNLGKHPVDGFEFRTSRMTNALSDHASGTAFDVCYDIWPGWGTGVHTTKAQQAAVHRLLDLYTTTGGMRVLAWGGDWSGKYLDEMHFEWAQSWAKGVGRKVTPADIANVIAKLRIDAHGNRPGALWQAAPPTAPVHVPAPAPKPVVHAPAPAHQVVLYVSHCAPGSAYHAEVAAVQHQLVVRGLLPAKLSDGSPSVDGIWGHITSNAYTKAQNAAGFYGKDADGKGGYRSLCWLFSGHANVTVVNK